MPSAVLIDDEPNLTEHLQHLLAELWPELRIAATGQNGLQALELVANHQPDLLFLDIRMPEMDGLAVAQAMTNNIAEPPLIVFATAYDDYAVEAFESAAMDYLLKPVTRSRLEHSIQRLKRQLESPAEASAAALETLLEKLERPGTTNHLEWLRAGLGDTTQLVPVADVVYFKSEHKYTTAQTQSQEFVLRLSLKELLEQLDPNQFWQIHRSLVVNVADISRAKRDLRGRYTVHLKRRAETLRSSAAFGHLFKQM
ncbi:MAG: LytR/AlgR family response regulator transcription factor [Pseudomonadales bacterium]